jgi:hypothetical protein
MNGNTPPSPHPEAHRVPASTRGSRPRIFFVVFTLFAATAAGTVSATPRLAVVISADQFRGDYLERFSEHLCDEGLRRFLDHGTVFENCHYRYASTSTGPGHATILTGSYPDVNGIVGNDWLDRESWKPLYVVEDPAAKLVGLPAGVVLEPDSGRSPRNLRASTVGDQLKMRQGSNARVFGVARKDRSSILMAGLMADAAYWVDGSRFITSDYYRNQVPTWVESFNGENRIRSYFGKKWERLLPAEAYEKTQGADDAMGEAAPYGLGKTFPRTLNGGSGEISDRFYKSFGLSPFENEFVTEFAKALILNEKLGRDDTTDLLALGYSQIDSVGHAYGPDSHEIMDSVVRLDRTIAELFKFLDEHVGAENYIAVFTSDHGVAPLPERMLEIRPDFPAGRVDADEMEEAADAGLNERFGPCAAGEEWFDESNSGFYLRPSSLKAKGVEASDAAKAIKEAVEQFAYVEVALTREEILAAPRDGDTLVAMVRRGYYAPNDRDVVVILKPYYLAMLKAGTTHGGPHPYDTHVPLAWFGPGIPASINIERVGVDDLAPTLSAILGVPPPATSCGNQLF